MDRNRTAGERSSGETEWRHSASSDGRVSAAPPSVSISPSSEGSSLPPAPSRDVAIAAREVTWSFMKIRRKCEATVHELISRTDAIVLFGYPEATILAISCSRGLSKLMGP